MEEEEEEVEQGDNLGNVPVVLHLHAAPVIWGFKGWQDECPLSTKPRGDAGCLARSKNETMMECVSWCNGGNNKHPRCDWLRQWPGGHDNPRGAWINRDKDLFELSGGDQD